MKYIAKQVPPEWQESPLFQGYFPENIAVFGNRDFNSHIPEAVQAVFDLTQNGDLGWALENREPDETTQDIITEYLPKENGEYSPAELEELQALFLEDNPWNNKSVCRILSIQTGKEWRHKTIRGCCQGEWQDIIYPSEEWPQESLAAFETEYFNVGEEWQIEDESEESFGTVYTHELGTQEILQEISGIMACSPDDITLYRFDGWIRTPKYKGVN